MFSALASSTEHQRGCDVTIMVLKASANTSKNILVATTETFHTMLDTDVIPPTIVILSPMLLYTCMCWWSSVHAQYCKIKIPIHSLNSFPYQFFDLIDQKSKSSYKNKGCIYSETTSYTAIRPFK